MRLKKVMWGDKVTNQQNDLVHSIYVVMVVLKCLSEVCRQSISV